MAARIKDIAKRADVSEATVSLVLNQKPGVKTSTRERVLQIAREMNYGATQRIALNTSAGTVRFLQIAMHGHTVNRDHNVFIADYIDGLTRAAKTNRQKLEISAFRGDSAADIAGSIRDSGIKGAVVLGTELSVNDIATLGSLKVPVVFLDTFYDFLPFDFVDMNNKDSVYTIIQHLVDHGHREIGFVRSAVNTHNFQLRDTGFWEAVQALDLDIKDRHVFTVDSTLDGAYRDMHERLRNRPKLPSALFCTNDIIAYGAIRAIREHKLQIPDDISIVAFDDLPASAVMVPPLTTIRVQKKVMGELAVQLLSRRIANGVDAPPTKIQVGGRLIVRSSVKKIA